MRADQNALGDVLEALGPEHPDFIYASYYRSHLQDTRALPSLSITTYQSLLYRIREA